jgi:Zn/Cd-binding protein ZinT
MTNANNGKKKRKPTVSVSIEGPNKFRLRHAAGAFEVGDDRQGSRVYTMVDTPLARAHARGLINDAQYRALAKFKHHWTCAGLEPSFGSVDLDRVFRSDAAGYSGMAKTEAQVFHRQRYREAVTAVGLVASRVIEAVVCEEKKLEDAGSSILGWKHPLQARAAAVEKLRDGGDRLAREWGL